MHHHADSSARQRASVLPLNPKLDAEIAGYVHDYTDSPEVADLQGARLHIAAKNDHAAADKLLDTLLKDSEPAPLAKHGARACHKGPRPDEGKPLEMKFTAAGWLAGLRCHCRSCAGRWCLVDFWATWLRAVHAESPGGGGGLQRAAWEEGLEIVGISLDQEKERTPYCRDPGARG